MTVPTAAVCVGFRARSEHDERVWDWCRARWESCFPDWPVLVGDSGAEKYNRSASRNVAARNAGGADVLVFANSDTTFYGIGDMARAVRSAVEGTWVLPELYVETSRSYWEVMQHENPADVMADPLSSYDRRLTDSPAGPQVMSAAAFAEVGGWDEGFGSGWGWEDAAMRDALDVVCGKHAKMGTAVHLWHSRGVAESPQANGRNRARWASLYGRAARQGPSAMRSLLSDIKSNLTP